MNPNELNVLATRRVKRQPQSPTTDRNEGESRSETILDTFGKTVILKEAIQTSKC